MKKENTEATKQNKEDYLSGILRLAEYFKTEAKEERRKYWKKLVLEQEECRADFMNMLGKPLDGNFKSVVSEAEKTCLFEKDGYAVYRIKFIFSCGCNLSGLFYEKGKSEKPLVLLQHGLLGTPELMTGFYGDTYNYNDILKILSGFDVNIFCPQLLLWDNEQYGVFYDREVIDNELKRAGSSIVAVEISLLMGIVSWFEENGKVSTFGMVGLSYGAFYSITLAAVDKRIKSVMACSFFHNADKLYFKSDLTWKSCLQYFSCAEIASLIYPRKLYIAMGNKDDLFGDKLFCEEVENLKEIFRGNSNEWFKHTVFDGSHEFYTDKGIIGELINDLKKEKC